MAPHDAAWRSVVMFGALEDATHKAAVLAAAKTLGLRVRHWTTGFDVDVDGAGGAYALGLEVANELLRVAAGKPPVPRRRPRQPKATSRRRGID